jgi:hypothetical protein
VDTGNHTIRRGEPVDTRPALRATANASDGRVRLAWPREPRGYRLESADSLAPGAEWKPVPDGILENAGQLEFTGDGGAAERYYRLRR